MTPAALSFQIKSLEEHLGAPLFHRLNRAVKLTEAGRGAGARCAATGSKRLARPGARAQRLQDNRSLTVTAGPAFTATWLAPRSLQLCKRAPRGRAAVKRRAWVWST